MSLQLAIIPGLEQKAARWLSADSRLILSIDDFAKVTASNCACKCHHVRIPATRWINSKRPKEHKATAFLPLFLISAGNNIRKEFVFFSTTTPKGRGEVDAYKFIWYRKSRRGAMSRDSPGGRQSQASHSIFWAVLIASSSDSMPPVGEVKNFLRLVFLFLSAPPFSVCQKAVEDAVRFFGK